MIKKKRKIRRKKPALQKRFCLHGRNAFWQRMEENLEKKQRDKQMFYQIDSHMDVKCL
jgi:hypothetical protein